MFTAKILSVDDDLYMRELVKLLLSPEGFEIVEASDGVEVLEVLESFKKL